MLIKNLARNNSAYGLIAYIKGEQSVADIEGYLAYNYNFIFPFNDIILAVNWLDGVPSEIIDRYAEQWCKSFPYTRVHLVKVDKNLGHTLGTMDLDNTLLDKCKELGIKWLFKSTEDVLISKEFLDKEIETADFYYLNGIGKGGMVKYDFDYHRIVKEDFYPNTNFYIINSDKLETIYPKELIREAYEYVSSISNYSGRVWEYIQGFSSEGKLAEAVKDLVSQHLIPEETYLNLLQIIDTHNIHDNSHKNIMIEGICHFHFPNEQVILIS